MLEWSVRTNLSDSDEIFDYYLIEMLYDGNKLSVVDWSLEKGNYPSGLFANPELFFQMVWRGRDRRVTGGVTGGGVEDVNLLLIFLVLIDLRF